MAEKYVACESTQAPAISSTSQSDVRVLSIKPSHGWVSLNLGQLWYYRELLYFLCWRDIKVRYKQTALGVAWAFIQPLCTMLIFTLFFGRLAKIPSDGVPYAVFSYVALVPWMFFANGLSQASESLVSNANLIKKIYFPRLVVPISSVLSGVIDFGIAFIVVIGMIMYFGFTPTINIIFFPMFLLLALVTALGVALWLSALNVQYRDVRYTIPFLIQLWMFASPIVYPSSMIPEPWRTFYGINPMVGVIEGFRWSLLGTGTPPGFMCLISSLVAFGVLVTGAYYFRRMERTFADTI